LGTPGAGILVGLGGGGLVNFLHYCLPNLILTAVELDPDVAQLATDYFGLDEPVTLSEAGRWTLRIGDGLGLRSQGTHASSDSYGLDELPAKSSLCFEPECISFLIIDVDSKDRSMGMSCPPQAFIETDYMQQISKILRPDGVLAMNVSARDTSLLELVCRNVANVFPSVFVSRKIRDSDNIDDEGGDLNVALFATRMSVDLPALETRIVLLESAFAELKSSPSKEEVLHDLKCCCEEIYLWKSEEITNDQNGLGKKKPRRKKRGKKK
jgi:hypothetical protein